MALDTESFNKELYDLLKVRGYKPVPLNSQNQRVKASQEADVLEFQFIKDGKDYGKAWITLDDAQNVSVYFGDEQQDSPNNTTPGVEYDDTWTGFLKHIKQWAQRRQLSFEISNKDRLGDDMRQREYYKMKEKLAEGYHSMGKKASYNDAVPNVKIVIQHSRALEEGEQRYRNVEKIFLENVDGERFLAPTTRPGIARVYARHIAEGGVPNDERWGHIKSICEEYNKMAGFVRATRGKEFNESAQSLINEGANHYKNLRETLSRMTGHRGYNAYFESWTPALMEDEGDETINELFVQETVDPRIESVMPILSRLYKNVTEVKEVDALAEWADGVINEKLVEMDDEIGDASTDRYDTKLDARTRATNFAQSKKNPLSKLDPNTVTDLIKFGVIMSEEELEEDESRTSNNPQGIPEGDVIDFSKARQNIAAKKRAAEPPHDSDKHYGTRTASDREYKLASGHVKRTHGEDRFLHGIGVSEKEGLIHYEHGKRNGSDIRKGTMPLPTKLSPVKEEDMDEGVLHRGAAWLAKKLGSFAGYKALKPGTYLVPPLEQAGGKPVSFTIRKGAEFPVLNLPATERYNPARMYAHIKAHIQSGDYETAPSAMQRDFSQKTMPKEEIEEDEFAGNFKTGPAGQWRNKGPKANKPATVGDLVGGESKQNNDTPLTDKEDYTEKRKSLQKIQMDPSTSKDPKLADELAARLHRLEKQAKEKGLAEGEDALARLKSLLK